MHAHYYTLIVIGVTFLIFAMSAFHTLMPQECVCVCVCVGGGGGYSDIFIYIRRLGPFLGFKILNFNFFFFFFFFLGGGGGSEISLFLGV